jgi:hypothetical protein
MNSDFDWHSLPKPSRRKDGEMKRLQKEEQMRVEARSHAMMRAGCHDCRGRAEFALRIESGTMVALCGKCASGRVTINIVTWIEEDRPYEPEGVFVEHSPGA